MENSHRHHRSNISDGLPRTLPYVINHRAHRVQLARHPGRLEIFWHNFLNFALYLSPSVATTTSSRQSKGQKILFLEYCFIDAIFTNNSLQSFRYIRISEICQADYSIALRQRRPDRASSIIFCDQRPKCLTGHAKGNL